MFKLNTIEEAIADLKAGKIIIVVDDEDRENEGDFVCAAEVVTPEIINFMATYGRGLICTPIEEERADALGLTLMVAANTELHETAFTISIDLIGQGCSTGISAYDRATGIRAMLNPDIRPSDFARPGHIFPLRAKRGGVLRRTGHTEASVDLARLAGFQPAGVVVEIMNEDGTMARLPELMELSKKHGIKIISIDDLVAYRMTTERLIRCEISVPIETAFGTFEAAVYTDISSGNTHLSLKKGTWATDEPVLVRVHSDGETGDILNGLFANYGIQLQKSLEMIAKQGKGVVLRMQHSEQQQSLVQYLQNYQARNGKLDRVPMSQKDFGIGAQILRDLGVSKMRLLTTSPKRRVGLTGYGLEVVENVML